MKKKKKNTFDYEVFFLSLAVYKRKTFFFSCGFRPTTQINDFYFLARKNLNSLVILNELIWHEQSRTWLSKERVIMHMK
jgi:hypothetical protein